MVELQLGDTTCASICCDWWPNAISNPIIIQSGFVKVGNYQNYLVCHPMVQNRGSQFVLLFSSPDIWLPCPGPQLDSSGGNVSPGSCDGLWLWELVRIQWFSQSQSVMGSFPSLVPGSHCWIHQCTLTVQWFIVGVTLIQQLKWKAGVSDPVFMSYISSSLLKIFVLKVQNSRIYRKRTVSP